MSSLLQAHSQSHPTSPVLVNSGFSQYDYFSTAPILNLSLTASPHSSVSAYSTSPRPDSLSTGCSASPRTPEHQRQRQRESSSSPSRDDHSYSDPMGFTLLPKVLTSPQSASKKEATAAAAAKRRLSVQVHFNELASVNWARPLKVEHEHDGDGGPANWASNSMKIFGASLQRSRRLNRNPIPFPSPASSSDEEPTTPSPILAQPLPPRMVHDPDHPHDHHHVSLSASELGSDLPRHCWTIESHGKGLGVSGVVEWDTRTPLIEELSDFQNSSSTIGYLYEPLTLDLDSSLGLGLCPKSASASASASTTTLTLTSPFKSPCQPASAPTPSPCPGSSGSSVQVQITPPNPRILATSQSLNSFSSPCTLLELQNLRRAASELEIEARRPIRVGSGIPQEKDKEKEKQRKIKRKAVPSIIETERVPARPSALVTSPSSSSAFSSSSTSKLTENEVDRCPIRPTIPGRHSSLSSPSLKSINDSDQERELINQYNGQEVELPGHIAMNRIELKGLNDDIFTRHGQFYQNLSSTQSAIDISPKGSGNGGKRSGLGYSGSMRINTDAKNNKRPESIVDSQFQTSTSSSSSSYLSLSEVEPTTPTSILSASQTEYFLSSVEKAFQKLECERKEIEQRTTTTPPGTTSTGAGWTNSLNGFKLHRRGFSKFLGSGNGNKI